MSMVLGLLGQGIDRSMAPMLHETLGRLCGVDTVYPRHDHDASFRPEVEGFLQSLAAENVTGINVTHPFKEWVATLVEVDDPTVAAIGAVNTLRFETDGRIRAWNTDFLGLMEAYRKRFGDVGPGSVAMLGAGGFGRAAVFAMAVLGATEIRLYDPDGERAHRTAADVRAATGVNVGVSESAEEAANATDGILNCSPVGMHLHPGCPIDPAAISGTRWVFDAVYAPLETEFLRHAKAAGCVAMSGSELFFWQGIRAFEIFADRTLSAEIIAAAAVVVEAEVQRRSGLEA